MKKKKFQEKKVDKLRELKDELLDLFLRDATELPARGFYQRVFPILNQLGGSIDKNTTQLVRIKELIIELTK